MPRRLPAFLALAFAPLASAFAAGWQQNLDGRYVSELSGWTLTVDPSRARLVSAVPPGGTEADNILIAGGHRVWLGPQVEWPVFWPPPRDWENSAAASVTLSDDATELSLSLPQTDDRFPALVRRYRLVPDGLLLVAAWKDVPATPARQAVQILQTRTDAVVTLVPRPNPAAPQGFGLLALDVRPGNALDAALPADIATPHPPAADTPDGALRLAFNGREEKLGFPPQPLLARFAGGHGLRLQPAIAQGAPESCLPVPDAGLFTQAYFGATAWAMVELEQLSPRLRSTRADGWVESVVRLEFLPPR